ncbi:MAG: T9SS type A sorting domain-containing protein [Bacteroidia bacterium]
MAIEDPIGRAAPSDPPNNPDPTDDQDGTELSILDAKAITLAITPQKINIELSPDQLIKQLALFDISGKLVFAHTPNSAKYDTQFEREFVGVHILIIQTSQGIMHQKLLLQY